MEAEVIDMSTTESEDDAEYDRSEFQLHIYWALNAFGEKDVKKMVASEVKKWKLCQKNK